MPTSWEEITLKTYVELEKLESLREVYIQELFLLRNIEVLCSAEQGELDEITIKDVNDLSEASQFLAKQPEWEMTKHIKIGDVDYAFPQDLNQLGMGEYVSMKTLQEGQASPADALPYILAVILRPATLVKDEETGKENWVREKLNTTNIEFRKNLFLTMPVFNFMGPISFFLSGNGTSTTNTKDSIPVA